MKQIKHGYYLLECECCKNILIIKDACSYEDAKETAYIYGWEHRAVYFEGKEIELDFCPICSEPEDEIDHA